MNIYIHIYIHVHICTCIHWSELLWAPLSLDDSAQFDDSIQPGVAIQFTSCSALLDHVASAPLASATVVTWLDGMSTLAIESSN